MSEEDKAEFLKGYTDLSTTNPVNPDDGKTSPQWVTAKRAQQSP